MDEVMESNEKHGRIVCEVKCITEKTIKEQSLKKYS
jgi:hypothetical protein